ncbi:MAG TPA: choice-of-anchor B family protein [Gaiellaceae bacterium]|nr:choice-of-anchor B family protein [Gaiellaceae bacterium]
MQAETSGFAAAESAGKTRKAGTSGRCIRGLAAGTYPCKRVDMLSHVGLAELGLSFVNDMWGWTDRAPKGKKGKRKGKATDYALVGGTEGTVIVNITNPKRPDVLGILPSHSLAGGGFWRDIKVYKDQMYVVSEHTGHGMQVFDLRTLRNDPPGYTTYAETAHYAGFGNAHNLNITEDTGYLYAVGSATCGGGLHMVDISTPASPAFAGCFADHGYVHDTQCVVYKGPDRDYKGREICFNSNAEVVQNPPPGSDPVINAVAIVDVTNKMSPVVISRTEYANDGHSHQGWLVPGHKYFLHGDELDELTHGLNTTTRVWDVRDLDNPQMTLAWEYSTASIDHNIYTEGKRAYASNYTSGLRVLDTSRVSKPALRELGYFDVYPENDNPSFEGGTWSNYPYFAQKHVVGVSSMDRGLFVLRTKTGGGG